jgi:hypothetical protein
MINNNTNDTTKTAPALHFEQSTLQEILQLVLDTLVANLLSKEFKGKRPEILPQRTRITGKLRKTGVIKQITYPSELINRPHEGIRHMVHELIDRVFKPDRNKHSKHVHSVPWLDLAERIGLIGKPGVRYPRLASDFEIARNSPLDKLLPELLPILEAAGYSYTGDPKDDYHERIECWECPHVYDTRNRDAGKLVKAFGACLPCLIERRIEELRKLPKYSDEGEDVDLNPANAV